MWYHNASDIFNSAESLKSNGRPPCLVRTKYNLGRSAFFSSIPNTLTSFTHSSRPFCHSRVNLARCIVVCYNYISVSLGCSQFSSCLLDPATKIPSFHKVPELEFVNFNLKTIQPGCSQILVKRTDTLRVQEKYPNFFIRWIFFIDFTLLSDSPLIWVMATMVRGEYQGIGSLIYVITPFLTIYIYFTIIFSPRSLMQMAPV